MDKFNGEDPYGLLRGVDEVYNGNERVFLRHRAWDRWDDVYGCGKYDYQVYALCNEQDPGEYVYGPLRLNYRPHYIGHGQVEKGNRKARCVESAGDGRQKDKAGEKYYWIEQMAIDKKNIHIEVLGQYYTKNKAKIVEIKLLHLMKQEHIYLTNATYTWTQVPFNKDDFVNPDPVLFFE
jgi:hypothetical protein